MLTYFITNIPLFLKGYHNRVYFYSSGTIFASVSTKLVYWMENHDNPGDEGEQSGDVEGKVSNDEDDGEEDDEDADDDDGEEDDEDADDDDDREDSDNNEEDDDNENGGGGDGRSKSPKQSSDLILRKLIDHGDCYKLIANAIMKFIKKKPSPFPGLYGMTFM